MYNEGDDLCAHGCGYEGANAYPAFADTSTMYGVQKNIQHLCSRTRSKTWGADAWKKVRCSLGTIAQMADSQIRSWSSWFQTVARRSTRGLYLFWRRKESTKMVSRKTSSTASQSLVMSVLALYVEEAWTDSVHCVDLRIHNADCSHT